MGKRAKFEPDLAEVERLAADGLTQAQICLVLGISEATLYRHKAKSREFSEALKRGQACGVADVVSVLKGKAIEGEAWAVCFYLKNRAKEDWKDKHDVEHSGGTEHTIRVVESGVSDVGPSFDTEE